MYVERHVVSFNGDQLRLPLKEFDLLEFLMRNSVRCSPAGSLRSRLARTTWANTRPSPTPNGLRVE